MDDREDIQEKKKEETPKEKGENETALSSSYFLRSSPIS